MIHKFIQIFIVLSISTLKFNCNNHTDDSKYKIEYYLDGTKKSEGLINNDSLKTGIWKFYYPNGNISNISHFFNGKKDGSSIQYFSNGQISDSINYKNGKFYGNIKFYFPNGKLNQEAYHDENGLSQGVFKIYYPSGKLRQIGKCKNGLMVGESIEYYNNGNIEHNLYYNLLGKKDSIWAYYSISGIVYKKEYYKSDSLLRIWLPNNKQN